MPDPSATPFFPALRPQLAAAGTRLVKTAKNLSALTLSGLEERFRQVLPTPWLAKEPTQRDRTYTTVRTFWSFLWQILHPGTSCREVVRQVQALFNLHGDKRLSSETGAYCQARQRLSETLLHKALVATAKAVQQNAPPGDPTFLQGHPIKAIDGSAVTITDTPANRKSYPKVQISDGMGFPMMRVVVFFCVVSGAILARLTGSLRVSELRLFQDLLGQLSKKDIVLGDRGFGHFIMVHLLQGVGAEFIGRSARKIDGRKRLRRLGLNDWLVQWKKPSQPSALLSQDQWKSVPAQLTVRIVRGSLARPGFRQRQVTLVTTLLDPKLYPASQILQAYLRRWRLELCFDDLKTTLQMEMLSCQSPQMVRTELDVHLIAYNLIRLVAAQAATAHHMSIECISFKGTLDALRQFSTAMSRARSKRKQMQLWNELLRTLADDELPHRPNRREPRAVKKQKNKYDRLNRPRHLFRDTPKRKAH